MCSQYRKLKQLSLVFHNASFAREKRSWDIIAFPFFHLQKERICSIGGNKDEAPWELRRPKAQGWIEFE